VRNLIRKLTALALLLVIPLQGVAAASLSVLQCPPVDAGAAFSDKSDEGAAQERDGGTVNHSSEHFFCHQLSSGIPVIPARGVTPDFPVFVSSIALLPSLFFPEQPQRPPFSASA